jgi:glycosyltransferase involved in cell wall biosynthesis
MTSPPPSVSNASHPPLPARGQPLHLAWAAFQRRQVSMAQLAGFDCWFMPMPYKGRSHVVRAWHYLRLVWRTLQLLRHSRPPELWLQLPQLPLLWVALLYRWLFDRQLVLVADCHNAVFVPPWSRVPLLRASLSACQLVLVHNEAVRSQALAHGVPRQRLRVLEDVPPQPERPQSDDPAPPPFAGRPRPWVLCAGSYGRDEPVAEVLRAAAALPTGTVVLTGRLSNAGRNGHDIAHPPANAVLADYLPLPHFEALLRHCDMVLAFTRHDGIQLSACSEALGFGRPLLASDTPLLRQMFGGAGLLVDSNDPAVWRDAPEWARRSRAFGHARRLQWQHGPLRASLALIRIPPAGTSTLRVQP